MTDDTAMRLWYILEAAPEVYPSIEWHVRNDDCAIMITARRDRWQVGFGIIYAELTDAWDPRARLSSVLLRMVQELDRSERT